MVVLITFKNDSSCRNKIVVLTTKHGKELVIAPALKEGLGLIVELAIAINTNRFGTFSRDAARLSSKLISARIEIQLESQHKNRPQGTWCAAI